jgi:hypothetical protein
MQDGRCTIDDACALFSLHDLIGFFLADIVGVGVYGYIN